MQPSPLVAPTLRSDLPVYPPLVQICRVLTTIVPTPGGGSSICYSAYTNQQKTDTYDPRDRETCVVSDITGAGLNTGYHICRLSGSYVTTTSVAGAITGSAIAQAFTPASMTGIINGMVVLVNTGTVQEQSIITAVSGTTFTCILKQNHLAGSTIVAVCPLYETPATGGGASSPGGSNTQLQYNNAGVFGGATGVTFTGTGQVTHTITGIGTGTSPALILTNTTAAGAGAQQYSPSLILTGQGWKTDATAGSQTVDWLIQNVPIQGAAAPTEKLTFYKQINGGGYTSVLTIGSDGTLSTGTINATTGFTLNGVDINTAGTLTAVAYLSQVERVLFKHFTDAGNVTTGETDLYSDTIAAGQLSSNGQVITAKYGGITSASATATRAIRVYFAGTEIYDTGDLVFSVASGWSVDVEIIRVSATVIRYRVLTAIGNTGTTVFEASYVAELTGLTLSNTNVLKITGQAGSVGAATNDIVAQLGYVEFKP